MANIWEKLQNVRVELSELDLRKGKTNTYAGYSYFELSDFLPTLNKLCQKHKLSHATTVSDDCRMVVLTLHDIEKPDSTIDFKIPMSTAQLKASHPVQNLGAVLTYSRRYLYMIAFDIVQGDILEAVTGKDGTVAEAPSQQPAQAQVSTGRVFVWDDDSPNQWDELSRLWQFVNCQDDLTAYVKQRAAALNEPLGEPLYKRIMQESFDYYAGESKKGNAYYAGMVFETLPF